MWRYALSQYIHHPTGSDVYRDEDAVIVTDKFPKSKFHLLILPKQNTHLPPTEAFNDANFKQKLQKHVEIAVNYILEHDPSLNRNDIQVGCHSVPSMNNLHIHVLTKDLANVKTKQHYNSFATQFFINWDELPCQRDREEMMMLLATPLTYKGVAYKNMPELKRAMASV